MYPLAGIAGGLLAMLGIVSLAVSDPISLSATAKRAEPAASTAGQVERTAKGDRLAKVSGSQAPAKVSVVEVVGVRDTAVVYRDRDGRVLFHTDPVANVTIVAKGVVLPEVTVRESADATTTKVPVSQTPPTNTPVRTLQEEDKKAKLVGCDPLVSPLAGSTLSRVAGRCIASMATGEKFAALTQ
jgi:hypothetical protein